jgi:hypothetical protein
VRDDVVSQVLDITECNEDANFLANVNSIIVTAWDELTYLVGRVEKSRSAVSILIWLLFHC